MTKAFLASCLINGILSGLLAASSALGPFEAALFVIISFFAGVWVWQSKG